jgi:hypothetical protein
VRNGLFDRLDVDRPVLADIREVLAQSHLVIGLDNL